MHALKLRAAKERTTVQHLVLYALHNYGLPIQTEDQTPPPASRQRVEQEGEANGMRSARKDDECAALNQVRIAVAAELKRMQDLVDGGAEPETEARLAQVAYLALEVFGNATAAARWLLRNNFVLEAVPIERAWTDQKGTETVLVILNKLKHSVPP